MEINLSQEQQLLLDFLEISNSPLLITGKAGTGKSFVINRFIETTRKKVVRVAPTGIAALNIGGQTIHSFFQLKPEFQEPTTVLDELLKDQSRWYALRSNIKKLDTLVIDEVSMCRVDLFDTIDRICQMARDSGLPFGGLQLILLGDPYQLPPVVKEESIRKKLKEDYGGVYFFNAPRVLSYLKVYELHQVFRQEHVGYKRLLDNIREGRDLNNTISMLNRRVGKPPKEKKVIILSTTNKTVNTINLKELSNIKSKEYVYIGKATGKLLNYTDEQLPTLKELHLREGAQVMMLNNDPEGRWANGTLATVSNLTDDEVSILIDNEEYEVDKFTWKMKKHTVEDNQVFTSDEGTFEQYPMKLAYAITAHKSQGQTYNSVYLKDFWAFDDGQLYVALSRCSDPNGLFIDKPLRVSDVKVNKEAIKFMSEVEIINDNTGA